MRLADPYLLSALVAPLALVLWRRRGKRREGSLVFPGLAALGGFPAPAAVRLRGLPFAAKVFAAALLAVALARPQTGAGMHEVSARGIDIVLAVDASTSMDINDVSPTRLEAAKREMLNFISRRTSDRIGLVVFAGTSFTRCPLTLDYAALESFIKPLKSGMVEDGTAIGMALANAVNRLKDSKAKSRVIILLTDGMNNRGLIDPDTAADLAEAEGLKVYTIGLGTRGVFNAQVDDPVFGRRSVPVRSDIDDALLRRIAEKTGGAYFGAQNGAELARIYEEIDRMEKSEVKSAVHYRYTERFAPFALAALALLLAAWLAERWFLRSLPE